MTTLTFGYFFTYAFFFVFFVFFYNLTFLFDKENYALYGSVYVHKLLNMKAIYPLLKALLTKKESSVQHQNCYPLKILVDQRGDQAFAGKCYGGDGKEYTKKRRYGNFKMFI